MISEGILEAIRNNAITAAKQRLQDDNTRKWKSSITINHRRCPSEVSWMDVRDIFETVWEEFIADKGRDSPVLPPSIIPNPLLPPIPIPTPPPADNRLKVPKLTPNGKCYQCGDTIPIRYEGRGMKPNFCRAQCRVHYRRAFAIANGACIQCLRPAVKGKQKCADHLLEQRLRSRNEATQRRRMEGRPINPSRSYQKQDGLVPSYTKQPTWLDKKIDAITSKDWWLHDAYMVRETRIARFVCIPWHSQVKMNRQALGIVSESTNFLSSIPFKPFRSIIPMNMVIERRKMPKHNPISLDCEVDFTTEWWNPDHARSTSLREMVRKGVSKRTIINRWQGYIDRSTPLPDGIVSYVMGPNASKEKTKDEVEE